MAAGSAPRAIRRGYVGTASGQVHYRVRAGAGPAVVMLHQSTSSGAMFESVMRAWPTARALYALDTPGFGQSFTPEGSPDMPAYGAWIDEAVEALGLGACHVLGHHTGAAIAVEIAAANPGRLLSMSLIGPVVLSEEERTAFREHYPKPFAPRADGGHLRAMWDYVAELGPGVDLELRHRELLDHGRGWRGHMQLYGCIWNQDFRALLLRVACPLLLACAEGDILWPFFGRATELRPDARRVVPPGSNFEPDEAPDAVALAVSDFIEHVAGAGQ